MSKYVHVAQIVLHPDAPNQSEQTLEVVTTSKPLLDQLLATIPDDRILHATVVEGHAENLDAVQQMSQQVVVVDPDDEDDTCDCPDCAADRALADVFKRMNAAFPPPSRTKH
jgi:hypothetical protein